MLQPLYARLRDAAEQYERSIQELEGLEKVVKVLRKLSRSTETKREDGEDVRALDQLIASSYSKLKAVVDCLEENKEPEVNFQQWADELLADLRARDQLLLSFNSDENSDSRSGERSGRFSDATSSRGASAMLMILQSNGRINEKDTFQKSAGGQFFFFTTLAWSLAVIGMVITIGFLAADFWSAQQNVAIQIERSDPTPLELPAVTLCSDLQSVPTFVEYPTKEYPGLPLFGISAYVRTNRSSSFPQTQISYPQTLSNANDSPIEDVYLAEAPNKCSNVKKGFDVHREMSSLHWIGSTGSFQGFISSGTNCQHCFRIGYKKRELLEPYDTNKTAVLIPAIQLKIFKSRMFEACQSVNTRRDPLIALAFASELELFAKELEQREILDFNGNDYSVLNQTQDRLSSPDHIDFCCNVYFFSGFFYPSLDNASISYRYEPETVEKWVKSGQGPYYSALSWKADDPVIQGPNTQVLQLDTYALSTVRVFAEEASAVNASRAVLSQTRISVLDSTHSSTLIFRKINRRGKNEYEVKQVQTETLELNWRVVNEYFVGLDYETFETETVSTMATMSWPEFITDVFEFIGLFTGLCIFTLIVAPAHSFGLGGKN